MSVKGWIEVSELYCKGCELCVHVCPPGVVSLDLEQLTAKGYHPARLHAEGCTGCALCAVICPDAAITVYRIAPKRRSRNEQEVAHAA